MLSAQAPPNYLLPTYCMEEYKIHGHKMSNLTVRATTQVSCSRNVAEHGQPGRGRKSKSTSDGGFDALSSSTKMTLIPFASTVIGNGYKIHDKWQKEKGDPTSEPHYRSHRAEPA